MNGGSLKDDGPGWQHSTALVPAANAFMQPQPDAHTPSPGSTETSATDNASLYNTGPMGEVGVSYRQTANGAPSGPYLGRVQPECDDGSTPAAAMIEVLRQCQRHVTGSLADVAGLE